MAALTIRNVGVGPLWRHAYQQQDSPLTLAEGLEEYYRVNAGRVSPPPTLPPESRDLFRRHDICHVIFGLDTTLADEAVVDTRTLISCDVGFRQYAAYLTTDAQAKAVFRETGYLTVAWATAKAIPRLVRAVIERFHMTRKWPWNPPATYHARSLCELRREYGIRIV
jgi:hypothetical protein